MAAGTNDCIDIGRLQDLLGKDTTTLPTTQVINSPSPSPTLVPRTPAKSSHDTSPVTNSHDRTGSLQLAYSHSLSYSQVDLGETQVDDAEYEFTPRSDIIRNTPPALLTSHDPPLTSTDPLELELHPEPEIELEEPESAPNYFPDAQRFSTPHHHPGGGNPLTHLGFNGAAIHGRMHMSLTQMFDSVSSPTRPRTAVSSLPPTPGVVGATKTMARTLSRVVPPQQDEDPPCSPTQPDYIPMQQSQEARRKRSVVFSSSQKDTQKLDSDSDSAEERRRRVERARRKGDEEMKRLFAGVRAKSEETRKKNRGTAAEQQRAKSASPPTTAEETGDEEDTPRPGLKRPLTITRSNTDSSVPTATTEDEDDVELPMHKVTPPSPEEVKTQIINSAPATQFAQTQYTPLPPSDWESLHQFPTTNPRRIRRLESSVSEKLPMSTIADSQSVMVKQTMSLKSMVPYNIPVPEFVKETSGLVPPTSSLTPVRSDGESPFPSALRRVEMRVPETSPAVAAEGKRKRRREKEEEGEVVPCSVEEGGFAAMEEESGFLSSRPEPDDVDMVGIVADVGAGRDPAVETVPVVVERKGAKRMRVSGGKEIQEPPQPKSAPTKLLKAPKPARSSTGKKPKPLARKTRSTTSLRRSMSALMPDTPTPNPAGTTVDTDDDTDILTSNNPAFSVSAPAPPDTSITAPERVFAWFRDGKTAYHPATILESGAYVVKVAFDDGTEDTLIREHVRALDLRFGDVIKVDLNGMKKASWTICGFNTAPGLTDCRGHSSVSVKAKKNGAAEEAIDVPVTNIYLVQHMWKHFSSRTLPGPRTYTPSESFSAPTTPSKRRNTPMTASFSTRTPVGGGLFAGMVFALSFGEKESAKRSITAKILSGGGKILATGFEELFFEPEGELALRPEYAATGFTAVIADAHSRRAKFLQALALGLPCLAPRWVEDSVRRGKAVGWECYLLAAGESRYLGCVRSRVLGGYGVRGALFSGVVGGRKRLLEGRGVVVVGAGEKRKPYLFLTYALGATRVVRTPNLESARGLEGEWDLVYVEGREKERAEKMWKGRRAVRVVDDEWVVQSLILGRLIDDD